MVPVPYFLFIDQGLLRFCEEVAFPLKKAVVWLNNPIEHPFCPRDKGSYTVDCRTDVSGLEVHELASAIMNVSDHATKGRLVIKNKKRVCNMKKGLLVCITIMLMLSSACENGVCKIFCVNSQNLLQ